MQEQAKNIVLGLSGPSDRFVLRYGIFRFHLKIKPLTAKQLIRISAEVAKIQSPDGENNIFPALMQGAPDLKHIAKVIAIATGTRYQRIVTRGILKLPLKDIETLFKIVHKQSDPTPFFFITVLAKGKLMILKPPEQ